MGTQIFDAATPKDGLTIFFQPWCGFCKRMKPDYQAAATEAKDFAIMAAVNVDQVRKYVSRKKDVNIEIGWLECRHYSLL